MIETPTVEEQPVQAQGTEERGAEAETVPEISEAQKLATDMDQLAYDHDYYNYMDAIEDREASVAALVRDIEQGDVAGIKTWLKEIISECEVPEDVATAKELLERLDVLCPEKQPSLTFYVAECMEFPVLGEYHEVETLDEARRLYEQMPSDRINGGKGIGFNLDDGSDFSGSYPLVQDGKVVTKMIDLVEHYRKSPLVQQAVEDAKQYYPDMREAEYQPREAAEADARVAVPAGKHSEKPAKTPDDKPGSRKESVLKALRERQAQVKDREKQQPVKQHDRKKEDQAL